LFGLPMKVKAMIDKARDKDQDLESPDYTKFKRD